MRNLRALMIALRNEVRAGRMPHPFDGICSAIAVLYGAGPSEKLELGLALDECFSGMRDAGYPIDDVEYPVPHPRYTDNGEAFEASDNKWRGEYGANRRALLDWCIDFLGGEQCKK